MTGRLSVMAEPRQSPLRGVGGRVLDLLLPGIDGIGILKFIRSRKELEDLPVFIVSNSNYFSGIVQDAWSEGATKFIRKGEFSPKGLVDEVRKTVPPSSPPPEARPSFAGLRSPL